MIWWKRRESKIYFPEIFPGSNGLCLLKTKLCLRDCWKLCLHDRRSCRRNSSAPTCPRLLCLTALCEQSSLFLTPDLTMHERWISCSSEKFCSFQCLWMAFYFISTCHIKFAVKYKKESHSEKNAEKKECLWAMLFSTKPTEIILNRALAGLGWVKRDILTFEMWQREMSEIAEDWRVVRDVWYDAADVWDLSETKE